MKLSIFGMLFVLIMLVVGPLVYFNGGDKYIKDWFSPSPAPKANLKLNRDVVYAPVTTDRKVKVFKWKDENGVWQFGNAPPVGLAGVETMTLQPDMNIMKSFEVPGQVAEKQDSGRVGMVNLRQAIEDAKKKGKRDDDGVGISQESLDNPYAPDSISELMNSSKNIQKMLNNRHQSQTTQ